MLNHPDRPGRANYLDKLRHPKDSNESGKINDLNGPNRPNDVDGSGELDEAD